MRNVKIGTKLLVILLVSALLPIFFITGLALASLRELSGESIQATVQLGTRSSEDSEAALMEQAETYLLKIAGEQAKKIDSTLERVESELLAMGAYLSSLYASAGNFSGRALPLPSETENGVWAAKYMLAPGAVPTAALSREVRLLSNAEYMLRPLRGANAMMSNVYLGTETGITYRFSASNAYDESYDARQRPWYLAAVAAGGRPIWTETEVDQYGIVCCTSAAAFYNDTGGLLGVIATDVTLEQMQADITGTRIGETGYAFVVDQLGALIAHPGLHVDGTNGTVPLPRLDGFAGEKGLLTRDIGGAAYYLAYHRLPVTNWYLAIVAEVEEIIAPALAAREQIGASLQTSQGSIREGLLALTIQFIVLIAAVSLLLLLLSFFLSRTITTPLHSLIAAVKTIGEGKLEAGANTQGRDEISELGRAFNQMTEDLKGQMAEVARVTAEKEKISAELVVAAKIQTGMVPSVFPAFPGRQDVDIFADMRPAKAVGGDFYDFFFLEEDSLCVCIADVSGKGVPAALFMVKAKTLMQSKMLAGGSLHQALEEVNELLCAQNEEAMFVTAFVAVLHLPSGRLDYVNAGHTPPLVCHAGRYERLEAGSGMVLGGFPGVRYRQQRAMLGEGDLLFLYTDGVTEAMNLQAGLYGEKRLLACLNRTQSAEPRQQITDIEQDVEHFAAGAGQADDITMLAVKRQGR